MVETWQITYKVIDYYVSPKKLLHYKFVFSIPVICWCFSEIFCLCLKYFHVYGMSVTP